MAPSPEERVPRLLTVAGSDPSGGAGIQADLRTFAAFGAYGGAVLTALTAQNTRRVAGIHPVPTAFVRAQLETLFEDVAIDAVKVGMVGTAATAVTVAETLAPRRGSFRAVVVDPVMVSKGGHRLVDPLAVAAIRDRLLPLATVITPNLHEAAALLGREVAGDPAELGRAAEALRAFGPDAVCVKGGAAGGDESVDALATAAGVRIYRTRRVATTSLHGSGCTFAAALAAALARGEPVPDAVRTAKEFLTESLVAASRLEVGRGHGPTHALHRTTPWRRDPATTPVVTLD